MTGATPLRSAPSPTGRAGRVRWLILSSARPAPSAPPRRWRTRSPLKGSPAHSSRCDSAASTAVEMARRRSRLAKVGPYPAVQSAHTARRDRLAQAIEGAGVLGHARHALRLLAVDDACEKPLGPPARPTPWCVPAAGCGSAAAGRQPPTSSNQGVGVKRARQMRVAEN